MNKHVLLFVFLNTLLFVNCFRILVVSPMPGGRSHYILGKAIARGLAEAGHDITFISAFDDNIHITNGSIKNIYIGDAFQEKESNMFLSSNMPIIGVFSINDMVNDVADKLLSHPKVQELLNSNEKFDAVLIQQFASDALKGFAHRFQAPLILLRPAGANIWINDLVGNPAPLSYIPDVLLRTPSQMSFWDRLSNVIFYMEERIVTKFFFEPDRNKMLKKYFPTAPDLWDLQKNVSLVLLSSHISTYQATPSVPSLIHIGGYHIEPRKALPQEFQNFLDNAEEGVILFSMGSNLKSKDLPKETIQTIVKVFGTLKEKILWKWEENNLPEKPPNVKIAKWLPQADILAHPNLKLFITHGGLLGVTETVYHGVPVLAVPIYGDQQLNAGEMVKNGIGLSLELSDLGDEEKLKQTLQELLTNIKYRENAKLRSKIMHDQPVKQMDLMVYWVEYVIRHNGAKHLRVAGADLPLYQYLLVDVLVFIFLVVALLIYVIYFLIKKMFSKSSIKKKIKTK